MDPVPPAGDSLGDRGAARGAGYKGDGWMLGGRFISVPIVLLGLCFPAVRGSP